MASMLEVLAAAGAGMAVTAAIVAVAMPPPASRPSLPAARALRLWLAGERSIARSTGWTWFGGEAFVAGQLVAGVIAGLGAASVTGLPVLAVPGWVAGVSAARAVVGRRARSRQAARQDAVLEAVRMLRQLLETGATSVNQAIAILAERGPVELRGEFRTIASRAVGRRQAWREARDRIAEPLFDMLAAAVLIQRPGGGEPVPLFADLESTVSSAQEVEREARALQAQARSASTIIVALPAVFLVILAALHSPYLDAFQTIQGELFLLAMLGVMAAGYAWMRRILELPGLRRVRLTDA